MCIAIKDSSHLIFFLQGNQRNAWSVRAYIKGCNIIDAYPALPMSHNTNEGRDSILIVLRCTSHMNKRLLYIYTCMYAHRRFLNYKTWMSTKSEAGGNSNGENLQFGHRRMIPCGHSTTSNHSMSVFLHPHTDLHLVDNHLRSNAMLLLLPDLVASFNGLAA